MTRIRIDTEYAREIGRRIISEADYVAQIGNELQNAIGSLDTGAWDGRSRARAAPLLDRVRPDNARLADELDRLGRKLVRVAEVFEQEDGTAARNLAGMGWVKFEPSLPSDPPLKTTMMVGEDGQSPIPPEFIDRIGGIRQTTLAVGEESQRPFPRPRDKTPLVGEDAFATTLAVGEEGQHLFPPPWERTPPLGEDTFVTTLAVGEEGQRPFPRPEFRTSRLGEDIRFTTLAVGEEGQRPFPRPEFRTPRLGEDIRFTTLAVGEEGQRSLPSLLPRIPWGKDIVAHTMAIPEDGHISFPNLDGIKTLAFSETGEAPPVSVLVGEEGQFTTAAVGEEGQHVFPL